MIRARNLAVFDTTSVVEYRNQEYAAQPERAALPRKSDLPCPQREARSGPPYAGTRYRMR